MTYIRSLFVRVLSLRSSVIHGFVTEPWYSRHVWVSCERAASSVCTLSRLRALFHVGAWCSDPGTHVLSFGYVTGFGHSRSTFCLFVWMCVHSCYILCCVAHSLCISLSACFHVVMSCVNTWLMSFLISCVFVSCFAHGWWFVCWPCACVSVLCEHVASVLVFCVPCALISICLDPTHLVTCLLIIFPQLLSLVTLLICSLYNLLVFAVPCGFVAICRFIVLCPVHPCPVQPVQSSQSASLFFPYGEVLDCLFYFCVK